MWKLMSVLVTTSVLRNSRVRNFKPVFEIFQKSIQPTVQKMVSNSSSISVLTRSSSSQKNLTGEEGRNILTQILENSPRAGTYDEFFDEDSDEPVREEPTKEELIMEEPTCSHPEYIESSIPFNSDTLSLRIY
jgi:hypothetical protein